MNDAHGAAKRHIFPVKLKVTRSDSPGLVEFTLDYSDERPSPVIFYQSNSPGFADISTGDGILCAIVHLAMREVGHLHFHGSLSRKMLLNLVEYQKAWVRWAPDRYSEVQITADEILDGRREGDDAISAYSGGVDAMFSLFQNLANKKAGLPSHNLTACLLVHGFDIPLSDLAAFETVKDQAIALHGKLGVDTLWIRTNSKQIIGDWESSFGAQLMACLHLFSGRFGTALIGSSEPYDELVIPWGSSPITDHLLSGGAMDAVHYGAGYSRTEKVACLSQNPPAVENLRVCWQGADRTGNCGTCEKCIRTRLNFEAVGASNPACFAQPFDPELAKSIKVRNIAQLQELESIVKFARKQGNTAQWADDLDTYIRTWRPPVAKDRLRTALAKTGLLGPAMYIRSLMR